MNTPCALQITLIAFCVIIALVGLYLAFRREEDSIQKGTVDLQDVDADPKGGKFTFKVASGIILIVIGLAGAIYILQGLNCGDKPNAVIESFVAAPSNAYHNQSSKLSWTVKNATRVTISGIGRVGLSGTQDIVVNGNKEYKIVAYGSNQADTQTVQVNDIGEQPVNNNPRENIINQDAKPNPANNNSSPANPANNNNNSVSGTTAIHISYSGDAMGCGLQLSIKLGNKTIIPIGNYFVVNNVPLGSASYRVSGVITCANGSTCQAEGSGDVQITDDCDIAIRWLNDSYGHCTVELVEQ